MGSSFSEIFGDCTSSCIHGLDRMERVLCSRACCGRSLFFGKPSVKHFGHKKGNPERSSTLHPTPIDALKRKGGWGVVSAEFWGSAAIGGFSLENLSSFSQWGSLDSQKRCRRAGSRIALFPIDFSLGNSSD